MTLIASIKAHVRGEKTLADLEKLGFKHGTNLHVQEGCIIAPGHCMLIAVGDDVTLAPRVHILAHDASTKMFIGYTRIAEVVIGSRVFIGAGAVVLPGVSIGDDVIVGAGSVVTGSLAANGVYAGNPARKIMDTADYIARERARLADSIVFDRGFSIDRADESKRGELGEMVHMRGGRAYIE